LQKSDENDVVEMLQDSCSKFSQFSNSENFFENLSTIDKVTVCNAMSSFLDHPVL